METILLLDDLYIEHPSWTKNRAFGSPILEAPDAMTVFEFDDFRAYLNHVRSHYPGMKRPITLERWAKKLNYRSPRSIAMVLKGQRLPSEDLVLAFSHDLTHSETSAGISSYWFARRSIGAAFPRPLWTSCRS
jgi:hypothetical protein